jgi:endoglucanase Acf2
MPQSRATDSLHLFPIRLEPLEPRLLLAAVTYGNGGNPWPVPTGSLVRIEAENFNQGGEGVGYHDLSAGNSGGAYRPAENVDIEATASASNGYDVTSIDPGEWLEFTVNVTTSGIYALALRAAKADTGSATVLVSSAADSSRTVTLPSTGNAQVFTTTSTQLELWTGTQVIRVQAVSGSFNFDYLEAGNRSTTPQPYTSDWQPWQIAADRTSWVEIEDFDRGGEAVAYHDTSTSNQGGKYRTHEGVDIEGPQNYCGGTYNLGYVNTGEWLGYTINVATEGDYTLHVRASTPYDGRSLRVLFGGVNLTGTLAVPNTGGWGAMADVTATVHLAAGTQFMRLEPLAANINFDVIILTPVGSTSGQQPYGDSRGLPATLSATGITRIEAEYFDIGGDGVAYHEVTAAKSGTATLNGNPFRPTDLPETGNSGTGIAVNYWQAGDWLEWTIYAPTAGQYEMRISYARGDSGNSHAAIAVNGTTQVSDLLMPSTGAWYTYQPVSTVVTLAAGANVLRFTTPTTGQINLDYYDMNLSRTFGNGGASWVISTSGSVRIEAENFDATTAGYVDTTGGNSGSSTYRPGTDVDLSPTGDSSGSVDVVDIARGESLTYTINAASTSYYFVRLRVSSPDGGSLRVLFNGQDCTGLITLPAAGGYQTVQVRPMFQSGWQTMTVQVVTGGFKLNWIELAKDSTAAVLADPGQLGSYAAEPPSQALDSVSDLYDRVYAKEYDWINQPAGAPLPTNDWWTNILESTFAGGLWPYPMKAATANNGVTMTYYNGIAVTAGNVNPSGGQTIRISGTSDTFTRDALVNYGDWTVQFRMEQSSTSYMDVTMGRGLPLQWYEFTGLSPVIHVGGTYTAYNATGGTLSGTFTTDHFRVSKSGQNFGIFAPAGTTFTASGDGYNVTFSGADKYLVVAALPDGANATFATFYDHAYAIPRGSTYGWSYDATAGAVTTTWVLSTAALKTGASLDTIQGWLPHNYRDIVSGPALLGTYQYATIEGPVKLSVGRSFTIVQPAATMSYMLPAPQSIGGTADFNLTQMNYYFSQEVSTAAHTPPTAPVYGADTYWGGKDLQQYAEFALMAQQLGNANYSSYLAALRTACTDWFTYTPGEAARYFAYYPDAKALIGFNPAYGSENFTDNHFHYGYEVAGASVLMMLDPTWAANYSAMVEMVAKQYANWDRTDTMFPYLRTFEPWSGHSYAGGTGDARGNNQESVSEAMQSWMAIVLLGQALNDPTITAAGMMGYTLESKAELEYWFDAPHQDLYSQMGYERSNVAINYDDWKGFATFFGANAEYVLGIVGLPLWPSLDFLGKYPAAMQQSINLMLQYRTVQNTDPTDNTWASFETGGVNDWLNINLGIQAQFDPQAVAQEYVRMWGTGSSGTATATAKAATTGIYYYQTQSYRTYGTRNYDYHLSLPVGGVYSNTARGTRTYVVYNPSATTQTVNVLDAAGNVTDSFLAAPRTNTVVTRTPAGAAPTLSGIESIALAYTAGGAAAPITTALLTADSDGTYLDGATVQITGNYQFGQDVLAYVKVGNITGAFNAITGTMILSGPDTLANYQAALRAVTYRNTAEVPSPLLRTVSFIVNDGTDNSNTVTRTINVLDTITYWTGAADTHWENSANWTNGVLPGPAVKAILSGTPTANQPRMYRNEPVLGLDIQSAGWTVDANGWTLSLGTGGLALPGGSTPTATIQLGSGNLVVAYSGTSPVTTILGWLMAGGGAKSDGAHFDWNGAGGITSSAAAASAILTSPGLRDNGYALLNRTAMTEIDGVPVPANAVVIRYTWVGDMDLDGKVTVNDYLEFLDYYRNQPPANSITWMTGDFNYDGYINVNDYLQLLAGFRSQAGPLTSETTETVQPLASATAQPATSGSVTTLLIKAGGTQAVTAVETTAASTNSTSSGPTRKRPAPLPEIRPPSPSVSSKPASPYQVLLLSRSDQAPPPSSLNP